MEKIKLFIKEKIGIIDLEDENILNEIYSSIILLEKSNYISNEQLDILAKNINYLDQKYDDFYKLVNLFDPIYVKYKKKIKDRNVKSLREKNRAKREAKNE